MFGRGYLVFTMLSLIAYVSAKLMDMPGHHVFNNTGGEVFITVSAKAKFNGTYIKSNFVPIKSHVTLNCKVWLNKSQEHLFSLMLVSFTLPNGDQVFPGKCTVDYKTSCKRCKILMKKVTLSDQGKYRCHAQYLSGTNIMKKYEDIFLHVKKHWCPSIKLYCHYSKKCVASYDECQRNFPSPSTSEVKSNTPTHFNYSETKPMGITASNIFPIAAGMMFITFLIVVAVVVWIKRRRRGLYDKKKIYIQTM